MKKIQTIELNLPTRGERYTVGQTLLVGDTGVLEITEIIDKSIEFENSIDLIYHVYVDDQLCKSIENSPVTITYFLEGIE